MAANVYECMLILNSGKYSGDSTGVVDQIHGMLEKHNVEVLVSRPWDERRLAYQMNGQRKGTYYLIYFRAEGEKIRPLESDMALNETIVRYLTLKLDPQLVEPMLALAKEEHAPAVHIEDEPASAPSAEKAPAAEEPKSEQVEQ